MNPLPTDREGWLYEIGRDEGVLEYSCDQEVSRQRVAGAEARHSGAVGLLLVATLVYVYLRIWHMVNLYIPRQERRRIQVDQGGPYPIPRANL
jgi:hypothetical protein